MKKSELKEKIKFIIKDLKSKDKTKLLPTKGSDLPISRFDLLIKFPEMIEVLSDLMTDDFEKFLKNIYWVAPKPTTFKIILINDQHFFLIYGKKSWTAKVEGKKYFLLENKDLQLASEAISRILHYGKIDNKDAPEKPVSSKNEEKPEEETPETSEETPEKEQ